MCLVHVDGWSADESTRFMQNVAAHMQDCHEYERIKISHFLFGDDSVIVQ